MNNAIEYRRMQELAKSFLALADELNEEVSAYIDGSNRESARQAFIKVTGAGRMFRLAFNAYYDDAVDSDLCYEVAEWVLPETN